MTDDGKRHLTLYSASQISLYRECARKWAWRYLRGIKEPQRPAQAFGDDVDAGQLQPFLRDGRPFDLTKTSGYAAAAFLNHLPPAKSPGLEVQKHFVIPSPTWVGDEHIGFGYQGYMDLWLPDSGVVPGFDGGAPFVGDFKTLRALKYAKSEATLRIDPQAMLYAFVALYQTRAKIVDMQWLNLERPARWDKEVVTSKMKVRPIQFRVELDEAVEQFAHINVTATQMDIIRRDNTDPLDLPPTLSQCGEYGGCFYRSNCNLSPAQILDGFASKAAEDDMSDSDLFAKLKAKKAAQNGSTPLPGQLALPATNPAPAPELPSWTQSKEPYTGRTEPAKILGINPPEEALPPPEVAEPEPPPAPTEKPKRGRKPVVEVTVATPIVRLDQASIDAIVDAFARRLAG